MFTKQDKKQIRNILEDAVKQGFLAGGNLLVIKDGKEELYMEDGFADIESKQRIARNTIFRLYSMTKPVTAVAIMILMERGVIDLYEPVHHYLPSFRNQQVDMDGKLVPAERDMTIYDLLQMTSGLVYDGPHVSGRETHGLIEEIKQGLFTEEPLNTRQVALRLGEIPLKFQPGSFWEYGTSADVLGAIVEIASGKSFRSFLRDEIFEPLEMKDTDFYVPEEKQKRLASSYYVSEQGKLEKYHENHLGIIQKMNQLPAFESGGAGLASTIDDYSKFAEMLMEKGTLNGRKVLSPRTVDFLIKATLDEGQQKGMKPWTSLGGYSYGNLMRVMVDSSKSGTLTLQNEYGWDGWLGAYFCNAPKEKLTILFMMQKTDAGTTELTRKLRNRIISSFEQ